jgi:putative oxidoreductase
MCDGSHGSCTCGGWKLPVGRILIGLLFVVAGWGKLTNFAGTEQYVASVFPMAALFTVLAIIFEFGGGLMLMTGFHARLASWMLIVFTALATLGYHTNWSQPMQQIMFLKNVAIIGGLLYVSSMGAGKWSLAAWNTKCCMGGAMCPDCKTEKQA